MTDEDDLDSDTSSEELLSAPLDTLGDPLVAAAAIWALGTLDDSHPNHVSGSLPPPLTARSPRYTVHPLLGRSIVLTVAAAAWWLFWSA